MNDRKTAVDEAVEPEVVDGAAALSSLQEETKAPLAVRPHEEVINEELARLDDSVTRIGLPSSYEWNVLNALSDRLARSNLVPPQLRNQPDDIMVILLVGRELGIAPMVALNRINIIEGVPSLEAKLQMALVQRAGHRIWVETDDGQSATCYAVRKDDPEATVRSETFTIQHAEKAGKLTIQEDGSVLARSERKGEKLPWEAYTNHMLRARAVSSLTSYMFADVLMGYTYTPEEAGEAAAARRATNEEMEEAKQRRADERAAQADEVATSQRVASLPNGAVIHDDDSLALCPACKSKVVDYQGAKEMGTVKRDRARWQCSNPNCHGRKQNGRWFPWSSFHNDPWRKERDGESPYDLPEGSDKGAPPAAEAAPAPEAPEAAASPTTAPEAAEAAPEPQAPAPLPEAFRPIAEMVEAKQFTPGDVLATARKVCERLGLTKDQWPASTSTVPDLDAEVLSELLDTLKRDLEWRASST